jgi:hypothetical protein
MVVRDITRARVFVCVCVLSVQQDMTTKKNPAELISQVHIAGTPFVWLGYVAGSLSSLYCVCMIVNVTANVNLCVCVRALRLHFQLA